MCYSKTTSLSKTIHTIPVFFGQFIIYYRYEWLLEIKIVNEMVAYIIIINCVPFEFLNIFEASSDEKVLNFIFISKSETRCYLSS